MSRKRRQSTTTSEDSMDLETENVTLRTPVPDTQRVRSFVNQDKESQIVDVYAFGCNDCNQVPVEGKADSSDPVAVSSLSELNLISLAAGSNYCVVAETNNHDRFKRVWTWGGSKQKSAQVPLGREGATDEPHVLKELWKQFVVQVCAGEAHTAALTQDGTVYTWGRYMDGRNPIGLRTYDETEPGEEPEVIEELLPHRIIQIASSANVTYALAENGKVYEFGVRDGQRVLERHAEESLFATAVNVNEKISAIYSGPCANHVFAVTRKGQVYAWGDNSKLQLGVEKESTAKNANNELPKHDYYSRPREAILLTEEAIDSVELNSDIATAGEVLCMSAGKYHSALVTTSGKLYTWGRNDRGQCGVSGTIVRMPQAVKLDGKAKKVICGESHTLVLLENGKLYAFGYNTDGRLGTCVKKQDNNNKPSLVKNVTNVVDIAAGKRFNLVAVASDKH